MSALVLDTNIVAYLMRGHPLAAQYRPRLENHTLAISFMTVAEMYEGACRDNWGERKLAKLDGTLRGYVVIPSTPDVCKQWAEIRFERRHQPISVDDAWIAACARAYSCPLVTHNLRDFAGISNLTIISEQGPSRS